MHFAVSLTLYLSMCLIYIFFHVSIWMAGHPVMGSLDLCPEMHSHPVVSANSLSLQVRSEMSNWDQSVRKDF